MNRNKRFMAGAAALVVAAVGVAGLQGLANAYGPTSTSLPGTLYLNNASSNTTGTTFNTFTDTITLAQSPTGNQNAGTVIAVTLSGLLGPSTGPVGVAANIAVVRAKISLTNAGSAGSSVPTATVLLDSYNNSTTGAAGTPACSYPATSIGTTSPEGPWATYGQFTASGNGDARLALNSLMFDDTGDGYNFGTALCAGALGGNNADYYVTGSGTNGVTNAKTSPADSTVVKNDFVITGPNAQVTFVGGTVTGAGSYSRVSSTGNVESATSNTAIGTVNLAGTVWGLSKASADFTVELCNVGGTVCDTANTATGSVLTTDGSGNLSGRVAVYTGAAAGAATTGARAIKITEGTNISLTPLTILGAAASVISPAAGGPGTVVTLTGSNTLPLSREIVSAQIANGAGCFFGNPDGTKSTPCTAPGGGRIAVGPYIRGSINQYVSPLPTASSTGTLSVAVTVLDPATILVGWSEKSVLCDSSGSSCAPTNTNVDVTSAAGANAAASTGFTVSLDQCIAYTGDLTGGAGCATKQNVNVSVLQGNLTQRVYTNAAATSGSSTSSASTPIVGTANTNSDATTVNLGTITSPFAPAVIAGTLNDITVSDNRGGTNGWSLTATGSGFTGVPSGTIAASALTATPSCAGATNSTAWDYSNAGKVAITGFDATLNAGGVTAGSAAQAFGSAVNLCTKSTAVNSTTGSTGGVYNVTSSLSLTVPAFQKAARYTALVTITLA
jgi:hypothetical protein